jgi:hypothetical protein
MYVYWQMKFRALDGDLFTPGSPHEGSATLREIVNGTRMSAKKARHVIQCLVSDGWVSHVRPGPRHRLHYRVYDTSRWGSR